MSEFTFLFRGSALGSSSPEQMQRSFEKWAAWFKELGAQGHIKDRGNALDDGGRLVHGRQKLVSDGPFAEAKDLVNGYIVVEARDLDHAVALAKGCPIFNDGGAVEVRPLRKM